MRKPSKPSTAGAAHAVTITLKSLKNPPLDLALPSQSRASTVLELKQRLAENLGIAGTDKVRLLYKKKPCPDSKTIKELLGDESASEMEFSVMIMGGLPASSGTGMEVDDAAPSSAAEKLKGVDAGGKDVLMEDAPVAQGESGTSVLDSNEFWHDLEGFLLQRVRDEGVAEKARKLFQESWKQKGKS